MTLIGLIGKKRAGKDSLARALADHGFERRAFVDKIRDVLYDLNPPVRGTKLRSLIDSVGWEAAKSYPEVRRLMQDLGEAVREHIGRETWIDAIRPTLEPDRDYVFSDARHLNEIAFIRELGGVIVLVRRGIGEVHTDSHISENAWTGVKPDHTVINEGPLSDLDRYAEALASLRTA